jgi:hypothetical protein
MLKTSRDSEIIYNGGKASNSGSELKAGGKAKVICGGGEASDAEHMLRHDGWRYCSRRT